MICDQDKVKYDKDNDEKDKKYENEGEPGRGKGKCYFNRIIELWPGPDKPTSLYNHHSTSHVMFDITQ